jgi:hypothetical protein
MNVSFALKMNVFSINYRSNYAVNCSEETKQLGKLTVFFTINTGYGRPVTRFGTEKYVQRKQFYIGL